VPAIDMSEDDKAYKISAELPGLDAKDVDVSVSGGTLVLKGEKRQEKEEKDKNYYFSERAYGSFQRAFELPASVDRDKVSADFSKGVLTITLPKTPDAQKQQKKIEVKSA
jgi:HSP20 family protein